jgi:hypothetical protein
VCERIEECASRVISLLKERHIVNILLFPELLGERSYVAYQALGWLAREGKVRYSMRARQCYLSLSEETASSRAS